MGNKVKGIGSIVIMSITFFLMLDTKYLPALGDGILEAMGLRAWTGDQSGTHLTVLYFGCLFLISLYLVGRYAIDQMAMKKKTVLILFIVLMTTFTVTTGMTARTIKGNSEGLLVVGFDGRDSYLTYRSRGGEIVDFEASFTLENFSDETQNFHISIDSPVMREEGVEAIKLLNKNGTLANFVLEGGQSESYKITLEDFNVSGGQTFYNGMSSGIINEILLYDDMDEVVKLPWDDFFGTRVSH